MMGRRASISIAALCAMICVIPGHVAGQNLGNVGVVKGTVSDPSGAIIPGATVSIHNPVSGYERTVTTDTEGNFTFTNIPFNPYHVTAGAQGFDSQAQDVKVSSAVPVTLKISLQLSGAKTVVTVSTESSDLIELDSTAHTDVDRALINKLPLESQSSSLSSLVTLSVPGVSADSNGLFHGLGDHADNSFSVDGQPITDQQSKVFSNQLPTDAVQSLEVIQGAPPAEYGDKTSLVIVATTRSGLGINKPTGSISTSYGTFGTANAGVDLAYGRDKWGNFLSANGLNTSRFLDGPEFTAMHDRGNQENAFDRFDFKPSERDTINLNLQFTRSWFQNPNSYDAQNATAWNGLVVDNGGTGPNGVPVGPQDQRSQIKTIDVAPTWTRLVNTHTVGTFGGWWRHDRYNYYPSSDPFADLTPNLQFQSIGQNRGLTNTGLRGDLTYAKGIHNLKAGVFFQHTFLDEDDALGIVDPTANPVCLDSNGVADTNPGITDPANCTTPLHPNPAFVPLLGCYDLTRTAPLPASSGCPNPVSGYYHFLGHTDVKELSLFAQDAVNWKGWQFNAGLRGDLYNGITIARQAEPRVGVAYKVSRSSTVLRASYARVLETPFNENLILASEGCKDPVIAAIMTTSTPCASSAPITAARRNEFHAGLQQAFGRYLVVDGEYIWKFTQGGYDFSILGNTPLTFPIEWTKSKIPGYTLRVSVPSTHGFTAYTVMSSVAARFFEPQVAGIGAVPSGAGGVFRIDHDEVFNQTTHLQYQPFKRGPWIGFNWRYDSGLVAGPVPCAGGNCANGPNGTDSIVDVSSLSPDQQFQAGLACNGVYATPVMPISPTGLCPANQYTSQLVKIPAAGTENDDHNPPRVAPRHLFDLAVGDDNIFNGDKHRWSIRLSAINLTDKKALYNFLSTFSGTHYVTPRTLNAEIAFHF